MAKDYGMRGEAASKLKKGKGAPPPEDDLGLPPEDGAMPPEEGGGGMPDLASLLGGMGGGAPGEMPPEEGAMPPGGEMPPGEEGMEAPQPPDLDTALGGVETALEGLPPEAAEEIRIHLNAIREIAASGGGAPPTEPPPMEGAMPMPDAGAGAGGMMSMEPQA
jgi:hypothetical protein